MQRLILVRIIQGVFTLFAVSAIVFFLSRATGNPADLLLPTHATQEEREQLIRALNLDRPVMEQYGAFLVNAVQGDFGNSLISSRPAMSLYRERFAATLKLGTATIAFIILFAVPLGILAALKRGSHIDSGSRLVTTFGMAVPSFWLGLVLMSLFAVMLQWLPASGTEGIKALILPTITLGTFSAAGLARLVRSGMIDVLDSEYIKMLRIKGLPEWRIIFHHGLRNAAIAPLTFLGQYVALLLGGTVVVEVIFAWPGVGRLAYDAIVTRDFPVAQAVILINAAIIIFMSLAVDILYAYVDPRIRY